MFKIVKKQVLAPSVFLFEVEAPRVANAAKPGQFVIVRARDHGERIPLTIADYNKELGTVTIVVQELGVSTKLICNAEVGDFYVDVVGPLGNPSEFLHLDDSTLKSQRFLFVAGGVGAAPIYPQVKYLYGKGASVDVILGARNTELLILKEEIKKTCNNLYVATDDGSEGHKGLVTDVLNYLITSNGKIYDNVVTIGPMVMMKFVALCTKKYGIKTIASLNTLMVDGTGMCGACRVSVGGVTKFTCVDGPEFDAHLVDFDEAMCRLNMYKTEEGKKLKEEEEKNHQCRIGRYA
ncbi:MAG: sulfide/dihydroorotate dehydrogenase-like FAD/NAD-binding protein [Bacteroidales bacterium]|nr:sulfide/dihydroorotate dehydrogenase-like FAD/NAD-binding protein [Bacteroidales bacterium]HPD95668.1 sulfide/dihydroorotate dehydrogenase-like FAD/NAD-binding protein [Tenuifilaceae bacterium]HRX31848.1 sulfide/dihydroorotate dehydrogenase-like FAD/NAD-binding protein [Tenuifilaceae bacterium]